MDCRADVQELKRAVASVPRPQPNKSWRKAEIVLASVPTSPSVTHCSYRATLYRFLPVEFRSESDCQRVKATLTKAVTPQFMNVQGRESSEDPRDISYSRPL